MTEVLAHLNREAEEQKCLFLITCNWRAVEPLYIPSLAIYGVSLAINNMRVRI